MLAVIQNIPVLIYCTRIVHSYVSVITPNMILYNYFNNTQICIHDIHVFIDLYQVFCQLCAIPIRIVQSITSKPDVN